MSYLLRQRIVALALHALLIPAVHAQTTSARNRTKATAPSAPRRESDDDIARRACLLNAGTSEWLGNARKEQQEGLRTARTFEREAIAAHAAHAPRREGDARLQAATAFFAIDSIDRALTMARSAAAILRQADTTALLADALSSLGALYATREQHDLALGAYRESLAQPGLQPSATANTLNGIGTTYQALGRPDSAFFYLDSARRVAAPNDTATRSDALNNTGLVHLELGSTARSAGDRAQIDSALDAFQASLDTLGGADDDARATTLVNVGVSHRRLYQLSGDRSHLEQALVVYRQAAALEAGSARLRELARTCHNIALVDGDLGDAARSRPELQAALRVHAATKDRYWQGMALAELAGSWRRLAPHDFTRAAKLYDSAAVIFAGIAATAGGDANRLDFAEQRMVLGVFDDWALTALHLGRDSARASLRAAERGRAQALLQLMNGSRSTTSATPAMNAASLSYLLTRDTLVVWLTETPGSVHVSVIAIPMDSVAAFVGDARTAIDATSTESGVQRRGGFGPSAASKRPRIPVDSALRRVATLLLPSELRPFLPKAGSDLVVIPAGALGLLPFAALPLDVDTAGDVRDDALGLRYALRYAPSFATLALADAESGRRADPRVDGWAHAVVVGDPVMPRVREPDGSTLVFGPLASARAEATWLADSLHVSPLLGANATEDTVRSLLPTASLVHLATHGLAYDRDDRARASFVALAAKRNDGLLTVGELLDDKRPMRATLVVLSACETARGNLKQAEGTVGLQRAFLARGASSVLVSLWNVSDEATEFLMRRFYTRWLYDPQRPSKAEALRLAERDVRDALGKDRADLWSAFQLVGAR